MVRGDVQFNIIPNAVADAFSIYTKLRSGELSVPEVIKDKEATEFKKLNADVLAGA